MWGYVSFHATSFQYDSQYVRRTCQCYRGSVAVRSANDSFLPPGNPPTPPPDLMWSYFVQQLIHNSTQVHFPEHALISRHNNFSAGSQCRSQTPSSPSAFLKFVHCSSPSCPRIQTSCRCILSRVGGGSDHNRKFPLITPDVTAWRRELGLALCSEMSEARSINRKIITERSKYNISNLRAACN
jgi:hypothetical protein